MGHRADTCTGLWPDGEAVSKGQAVRGGSVFTENVGPDAHCLQTLLQNLTFPEDPG